MPELTKRQQAIVDLLWGTLKKSPNNLLRCNLPTGDKTKLGLALTVERIFAESENALLKKIADELEGIDPADRTTAEKNILRYVVSCRLQALKESADA